MKGESGFDYFCESFIVCGKTQLHLLNQILEAYEEKIYENEGIHKILKQVDNLKTYISTHITVRINYLLDEVHSTCPGGWVGGGIATPSPTVL